MWCDEGVGAVYEFGIPYFVNRVAFSRLPHTYIIMFGINPVKLLPAPRIVTKIS